jgi:hypothetical protein
LPAADPLLAEIESHFHATKKWFGMVADLRLDVAADASISPRFETLHSKFVQMKDAAGQTLGTSLPGVLTSPLLVQFNGIDGFTVRTVEIGVPPTPAEVHRGVIFYRGAFAGGELFYKLTPTHVDEYLYLRQPPAHLRREFEFDAGPAVFALREAGDMLEAVGKDGVARLRLSAPLARAADGTRRRGTVHVVGRTIIEEIDLDGLAAPVLVDPDWSTTGSMTVAHWADAAWRRPDTRVMAVGGCALASCPQSFSKAPCSQVIASTDVWDPPTGTWTSGPPLITGRYLFSGVPLPSGDMLVAGGCTTTTCGTTTSLAERFSVGSSKWVAAGTLSSPRANTMATALPSGDVILAGGCDTACTSDTERWSPATNRWKAVSPLASARGFGTATSTSDGRFLVTGGCADPACATVLDDAVIYDPTADTWSPAGTMSSARAGHTATLLPDGSVLVAGGCQEATCASTQSSVDLWSAGPGPGGTFSPAPPMTGARHHHTATLLDIGEVLVAGGAYGTGATIPSSEVYLPIARKWIGTTAMLMSRAYHVGVELSDGRVVVAGGCNPETCIPFAEVFSPASLPRDGDGGITYEGGTMTPDAGDAGPVGPAPLARSPHPPLYRDGVVTCATDTTQDLTCPVAGWELEDGDFQPDTLTYEAGVGEVTDEVTKLVWQEGGDGQKYDHASAEGYCKTLSTAGAPAGSFRLPSVVELMTLVDYGVTVPSIDPRFKRTLATNYWTSTRVVAAKSLAWTVKFDFGEVIPLLMSTTLPVRCVRGKSPILGVGGVGLRKAGPLKASGETVIDATTGLEWQRRDDGIKRNWQDALTHCARLPPLAGKTGWHLANISELLGITQYDTLHAGVATDPVFQDTKADIYWSSTQNEGAPSLSWSITFNLGIADGVTVGGLAYARCVRHLDEPPLPTPPPPSSPQLTAGGGGCGCEEGAGASRGGTHAVAIGAALVALLRLLRRSARPRHGEA